MGYERNDRRTGYNGDRSYGGYGSADRDNGGQSYAGGRPNDDRARSYGDYGSYGGASQSRDYRGERFNDRSDDGRDRQSYDTQGRGFLDRAGDEVRSWFGDEDAERRRTQDERNDRQGYRSRHEHDPHYRTWRDRQMELLDRDYDEYRQHHQSKFDTEFSSWRSGRQGQRDLLNRIEEHFEVVGSDGEHVGTVDHVHGDQIELTKSDQDAGGHHHIIPSSWLQSVEDKKVTLSKTADQAKQHWRDEHRNGDGGMFGANRGTNLNRSFSGTY